MDTEKTILVIDDDKKFSFGLVAVLRKAGYQVKAAYNGKDGLLAVHTETPDLIICDMMMPPPNGIQVKKELSDNPDTQHIPFLFLTARTSQVDKIAGLDSGADDYITKPVDVNELLARIQAVFRRSQWSHQRGMQDAANTAKKLAYENQNLKMSLQIDPLTGVMNRRALDSMNMELFSFVVMIDLDRFKQINDTYGHAFGDEVLVGFADLGRRTLRQNDMIIRWGGDEFLLVLTMVKNDCTGLQDVERVIERIQKQYSAFHPELGLTFSYGIAHWHGSFEEALKKADQRMYEMKNQKRAIQNARESHSTGPEEESR